MTRRFERLMVGARHAVDGAAQKTAREKLLITRNAPPPEVGPPSSVAYGWMTVAYGRKLSRSETLSVGNHGHSRAWVRQTTRFELTTSRLQTHLLVVGPRVSNRPPPVCNAKPTCSPLRQGPPPPPLKSCSWICWDINAATQNSVQREATTTRLGVSDLDQHRRPSAATGPRQGGGPRGSAPWF